MEFTGKGFLAYRSVNKSKYGYHLIAYEANVKKRCNELSLGKVEP
jgi:hypothetical protein